LQLPNTDDKRAHILRAFSAIFSDHDAAAPDQVLDAQTALIVLQVGDMTSGTIALTVMTRTRNLASEANRIAFSAAIEVASRVRTAAWTKHAHSAVACGAVVYGTHIAILAVMLLQARFAPFSLTTAPDLFSLRARVAAHTFVHQRIVHAIATQ